MLIKATHFRHYFFVLTLIFFILRFFSFMRTDIGFDPYDSPSYFSPTWDSPIRMPIISYLFSFLEYFGAIVFVQTMIGIIAWIFLSYAISLLISSTTIKTISSLLVYSLALSSPIVAFDSIILSESLTIFGQFLYLE